MPNSDKKKKKLNAIQAQARGYVWINGNSKHLYHDPNNIQDPDIIIKINLEKAPKDMAACIKCFPLFDTIAPSPHNLLSGAWDPGAIDDIIASGPDPTYFVTNVSSSSNIANASYWLEPGIDFTIGESNE